MVLQVPEFSPYSFYSTVSPGYDYTTGTGSGEYLGLGTTQVKYANPDVKWETSEQYNFWVLTLLFE